MAKATQFKKGQTPWNKGKKTGLVPKSAFKKGNVPKFTEAHRKHLSEALTGKKTGRVPKTAFKKGTLPWNKGVAMWEGKVHPRGTLGRKATVYERKKMSEARRGDKCHFWKGGITPVNTAIRMSFEYKLWRESVFQRDDWTCQWCGTRGAQIHADHIKPFAYYPELRLAIDNGRTLCVPCHKTTDSYLKNNKK